MASLARLVQELIENSGEGLVNPHRAEVAKSVSADRINSGKLAS
jgi:hypothetical protein